MDICTLDFESAYSQTYSLSKMTTQKYLDSHMFEVIGVAMKMNDEECISCSGDKTTIYDFLKTIDWDKTALCAHNAMFDAGILNWHFSIRPKLIIDTLSMARALHGTSVGGSLAKLATYYDVGAKGTEVLDAKGKWRKDFSDDELAQYMAYCRNDVDLTREIFKRMAGSFNKTEIRLIDMTIRMFTEPYLCLDRATLERHLDDVRARKDRLLEECGIDKDELMSNPKLAQVLESFGVEPPMKISARTGKEAYAFAKSDEAFKALLDHDDERVQAIVAARLGVKSTLEETRTERFISICDDGEALPVPLKYYGAITGRWSATDSINLQNIPRGSKLKTAIVAPSGYSIVGADLSNVELRVGLAFAGQNDKLKMLGDGLDLYKDFAAGAFGVAYDQISDEERFVGKTACIAEGELVLTPQGLKPIEKITVDDRVWDGVEWVQHDGLIYQGVRDVIEYQGLRATPDHIVYLEDGTTSKFGTASNKRARIANTGNGRSAVASLGDSEYGNKEEFQERVHVARSKLRLRLSEMAASRLIHSWFIKKLPIMRGKTKPYGAGASARRRQIDSAAPEKGQCNASTLRESAGQGIQELWCTGDRISLRLHRGVRDLYERITQLCAEFIGRSHRQSWALCAGESALYYSQGASGESSQYLLRSLERATSTGERVARKPIHAVVHSLQVCKERYDRRRNNSERMGVSSQETQGVERAAAKVRVYDLLNAGPRHRFTVSGVLVSNCLSLIYGTGAKKLRAQCKMLSGKDIGEDFAQSVVDLYRQEYAFVKAAWYDAGKALDSIIDDSYTEIGLGELRLPVEGSRGIKLPSGLYMTYPELKEELDDKGRKQYVYKTYKGPVHIHPAKCFQNVIQALARCVMGEDMVRVHKRYPVSLTIHDAIYCAVKEDEAEQAVRDIVTELRKSPAWLPNMPLDAEGGYGKDLSFKMKKVLGA